MHFYINGVYLAFTISLCGSFILGHLLLKNKIHRNIEDALVKYYRNLYNEQMNELCNQYKQERVALVHRYEGLTADIESEIAIIRRALDPNRTQECFVKSNVEAITKEEGIA